MKRIILAALVGVLVISTADAEFQDGNQLITECGRGIPWSDGVCNGYITGALDLLLSLQKTKSLSGKFGKVCLPNNLQGNARSKYGYALEFALAYSLDGAHIASLHLRC
jgi:hypothetical protein